jgi:hypothetical protein
MVVAARKRAYLVQYLAERQAMASVGGGVVMVCVVFVFDFAGLSSQSLLFQSSCTRNLQEEAVNTG